MKKSTSSCGFGCFNTLLEYCGFYTCHSHLGLCFVLESTIMNLFLKMKFIELL